MANTVLFAIWLLTLPVAYYLLSTGEPNTPTADHDVYGVLLTISGGSRSVDHWAEDIERAVQTVRDKLGVTQVILQPVVGAPDGGNNTCGTRAGRNHPDIDQAIARVASRDAFVQAGASPVVHDCSGFADRTGHLTQAAAAQVARDLGAYYAVTDALQLDLLLNNVTDEEIFSPGSFDGVIREEGRTYLARVKYLF